MKKAITFYFGNAEWESQNPDRHSSEWNKVKIELNEIKKIWDRNTKKEFPNLSFIIGEDFREHRKQFKNYYEPKGKYPIKDDWLHRNLGNGLKTVERPYMIGSDGLGKLHQWATVCQTKYLNNEIIIDNSYIRKLKSYEFIKNKAKENSWDAYSNWYYRKHFIYHIFGHVIKLKEMKSCPIMNTHKKSWQLGSKRTQYMMGLDTDNTLNKRLEFYIKRKFK